MSRLQYQGWKHSQIAKHIHITKIETEQPL